MSAYGGGTEIKIVIADGCTMMASTLLSNLNMVANFKVVGLAENFDQLMQMVMENAPHVVVMDDRIESDMLPVVVLRRGRERAKQMGMEFIHWVVIGSTVQGAVVSSMMVAGCDAYLFRNDHLELGLKDAIRQVLRGKTLTSQTASAAQAEFTRYGGGLNGGRPIDEGNRQELMQLLQLTIEGKRNDVIREIMGWGETKLYRKWRELRAWFGKGTNEAVIAAFLAGGGSTANVFFLSDDEKVGLIDLLDGILLDDGDASIGPTALSALRDRIAQGASWRYDPLESENGASGTRALGDGRQVDDDGDDFDLGSVGVAV